MTGYDLSASSNEPHKRSFREMAEDGSLDTIDSQPLQLSLIPVYLRSRKLYYLEKAAAIRKRIDDTWDEWVTPPYDSRADFDASDLVEKLWRGRSPPAWELNDIVGFIDVRLLVHSRKIQAALFMPDKQVSRRLKNKEPYVFIRMETLELGERATNHQLRTEVTRLVDNLRSHAVLKRRFIDLEAWRRTLDHVDLVGLIKDEARLQLGS